MSKSYDKDYGQPSDIMGSCVIETETGVYYCPYCEVNVPKEYVNNHKLCMHYYPKGIFKLHKKREERQSFDYIQANRNKTA